MNRSELSRTYAGENGQYGPEEIAVWHINIRQYDWVLSGTWAEEDLAVLETFLIEREVWRWYNVYCFYHDTWGKGFVCRRWRLEYSPLYKAETLEGLLAQLAEQSVW